MTWDEGPNAKINSADIWNDLRAASKKDGVVAKSEGDIDVRAEPPGVTTGFWRGVGPNNNVFAIESFMNELARKANMDPGAFRLGMLDRATMPARPKP